MNSTFHTEEMNDRDRLLRIHSALIECDTIYGELWHTKLNEDSIELNDYSDNQRLTFIFRPYKDSTKCCIVEVQGFHGDRRVVQQHFRSFNGRKALIPLKPAVIHKFIRLVIEAQHSTPAEVLQRLDRFQRYIGALTIGKHRYALIFDGRWRLIRYDHRNATTFSYTDQVARYIQRFER